MFYVSLRAAAALARTAPRGVAHAIFSALGRLAWAVRRNDRRRALLQLAIAFPELAPHARRRLGRRSFELLGCNLVDAARDDVVVRLADADAARLRALAGGPLLLLTGHLGCFELLARTLARALSGVGVVTADPHNRRIDAWLRRERERSGISPFDRRHQALAAARWLAGGRPLAVAADHRTAVASLPAPWFGRLAPTPRGVAWLARRTGARVVAVGIRRHGAGHEVWIGDEVPVAPSTDETGVLSACNAAIEALIRRAPEEWTWFHDRYGTPQP